MLKQLSSRCTVRVREQLIVKYGLEVESVEVEVETMISVRQHLESLVSRLFVIY